MATSMLRSALFDRSSVRSMTVTPCTVFDVWKAVSTRRRRSTRRISIEPPGTLGAPWRLRKTGTIATRSSRLCGSSTHFATRNASLQTSAHAHDKPVRPSKLFHFAAA